jgi:hypothetical protein
VTSDAEHASRSALPALESTPVNECDAAPASKRDSAPGRLLTRTAVDEPCDVEQRISTGDIADELGCDRSAVSALLAAGDIPRPRPTRGRPRRAELSGDHDWLRRRYLDTGASLRELVVEIGATAGPPRRLPTSSYQRGHQLPAGESA